jgi:hypothetical protein
MYYLGRGGFLVSIECWRANRTKTREAGGGGKERSLFPQIRGPCFFERHPIAGYIVAPRSAEPEGKIESEGLNSRIIREFFRNFG